MSDVGLIPCACWCGQMMSPNGSKGRQQRFLPYHYLAPHLSEAWRRLTVVDDDPSDDCWVWPGGVNNRGYGVTKRNGVNYAHRAAWVQVHGPIPTGMDVCHHCDNPPCFRPRHLFLGTAIDNMRDMAAKGRWRNGGAAPLDIEALTAAYLAGTPLRQLYRQFNSSMERVRSELTEAGVQLRRSPEEWKPPLASHCHAGHRFDEVNTYVAPKSGNRHCRKCRAAWARSNRPTRAGAA